MRPAEFEPTIPASERPQTRVLDRAATGVGASSLLGPNTHLSTLFSNTISLHSSFNITFAKERKQYLVIHFSSLFSLNIVHMIIDSSVAVNIHKEDTKLITVPYKQYLS